MKGRILVLGAAGRLGYAAAGAFRTAGWGVTSLVRPGAGKRAPRGTEIIETNDRAAAVEAAKGADIVLHALNPPYAQWHLKALPLAFSAIEAAEAAGATLMFPGNVYNYGTRMPPVLDEATPMQPDTRKGVLRVEIEQRLREASDRGMRTIILRAGDFFGGGHGSWLDLVISKEIHRGRVTYPGPLDIVHEWAYLPDLVGAMVRLAAVRERLGAFETFGFPGHAVTGRDFVGAIAKAARRGVQIRRMQWWMIHALRPFVPLSREIAEIAYLWRVPHQIRGDKLSAAIGQVPHTPLDVAMGRALRDLGAIA
jgi:nucleoside-diphosphate-sugar epimerase